MSKNEELLDNIARMIDHTLLKPEATPEQIVMLCAEALEYKFASVCVNPIYVPIAAEMLKGSETAVCTVIGFPLGATTTAVKVFETEQAIQNGATEIDMVLPIGMLKAKAYHAVSSDITAVVQVAHAQNAIVKVIIETALLDPEEKKTACILVKAAGADYLKTSTGFAKTGATTRDIRMMRNIAGTDMGVKAAGGIRTYTDAKKMINAGATRLGASAGVKIIQQKAAGKKRVAGWAKNKPDDKN